MSTPRTKSLPIGLLVNVSRERSLIDGKPRLEISLTPLVYEGTDLLATGLVSWDSLRNPRAYGDSEPTWLHLDHASLRFRFNAWGDTSPGTLHGCEPEIEAHGGMNVRDVMRASKALAKIGKALTKAYDTEGHTDDPAILATRYARAIGASFVAIRIAGNTSDLLVTMGASAIGETVVAEHEIWCALHGYEASSVAA